MDLTPHEPRCSGIADKARNSQVFGMSGAPNPEPENSPDIEPTGEMIAAGANLLEEYLLTGSGLANSPTYVVERVYLAMEKVRAEREAMLRVAGRQER
jgi:hypothetical protein